MGHQQWRGLGFGLLGAMLALGHVLWYRSQRDGSLNYARGASAPMSAGAQRGNGFSVRQGETITVRYTVASRRGRLLICLNKRRARHSHAQTVRYYNTETSGTWQFSAIAPVDGIYEVTFGAPLTDFVGQAQAAWHVG